MLNTQDKPLPFAFRGPVQALKDLDDGLTEAAIAGLNFADWMQFVKDAGYPLPCKSKYRYRVIGQDTVAVLMHKALPITSLSRQQLANIFTGKIRNWSAVGGPVMPIVVILGTQAPGLQYLFQQRILNGAAYRQDVVLGTNLADLKSRVLTTPGALCLGISPQVDDSVHAPAIPEISRPITLITRVSRWACNTLHLQQEDSPLVHRGGS